jgi:hypothetical protein
VPGIHRAPQHDRVIAVDLLDPLGRQDRRLKAMLV